jgi:hypothetical protein
MDSGVTPTPDSSGGGGSGSPASNPDAGMFAIPPGMTQIFDGTTTKGWDLNPGVWSVDSATMSLHAKTGNGGALGKTLTDYDDFRIVVTERMVATMNHLGICIWGAPSMPGNYGYGGCIDVICPHGSLWDYGGGGGVFMGKGTPLPTDWHQVEVLAIASTGQIQVAVNGMQTTNYTRAKKGQKGPIGLQYHAGASDEEYKDIWIESPPAVMKLLTVH